MNLAEWVNVTVEQLKASGFTVEIFEGFPLLRTTPAMSRDERFRILQFDPPLPTDRVIYAEGMLFMPKGFNRLVHNQREINLAKKRGLYSECS